MRYSAGRPAISADSGCPCPDMRWQEPHAMVTPASPFTIRGAGACSSGNQSGGVAFPAIFAASYSFALPGTRTVPVGSGPGGWTLSGMLNAHEGKPLGTVSGVCAGLTNAHSEARGRTTIQVFIRYFCVSRLLPVTLFRFLLSALSAS